MARMGLAMRDDPPKTIDVSARAWGPSRDGFALSLDTVPLREDASVTSNLSVVLRNEGAVERKLSLPGWLFLYRVKITGPEGGDVPLSAFGREMLNTERGKERFDRTFPPEGMMDAQIPLGSLFDMRVPGEYRVEVSCEVAGVGELRSNPVTITISGRQ
jgi:hypothetical protein